MGNPKDMKEKFIIDSIDHITKKAVEESSTCLIPSNSLLMVIRSGILKKTLPVAINLREVTINQDMKAFVFHEEYANPVFMLYFFLNFQKHLLKRVRSVTADNLEFGMIKNVNVISPPISLQLQFAKIVENIRELKLLQKKSSEQLQDFFNVLSQKSFEGTLLC